jgi:beta-lactamase regulating signal transducer with metallopeptidase domain
MTLALIFETALRTIVLAALAGLGLALFRVRSSTVKLAVWRVVLYASLLMPFANLLPKRAIVPPPAPVARAIHRATTQFAIRSVPAAPLPAARPIDWPTIALRAYALVAALLLLRALLGLLRLRHLSAMAAPMPDLGPDVFETERLAVPVTCGILRPRILLPADWCNWTNETLDAVLAHERSHIAEHDFLTQCMSKVNRALYWANPLVWWLDRQVAALAEHASDDAALTRVGERPTYAAMLLGFAGRQANLSTAGVSMARNAGGVSSRIDRVLDEARSLSRPLSVTSRVALAAAVFAAAIVVGACRMSNVAAAQTNAPELAQVYYQVQTGSPHSSIESGDHWWRSDRNRQEWVLITQHGTSMNGSSGGAARAKSLAAQTHGDYLWFSHDGKEYLIDDPKTLAEIESWYAPMEELGRQQGELGEKQGALGEQMAKLGEEMSKMGEQMSHVRVEVPDMKKLRAEIAELQKLKLERLDKEISSDDLTELQTRLGEIQSRLGEAQSLAGEKQSQIGELQGKIGERQALLGEQQGKLGEEQGRLGEEQGRIAEEAERKLRRLFEQAVQDGRAKPVR